MAWFTAPVTFLDGQVLTASDLNTTVTTIRDGTVTVAHGGTGLTSGTSGGVLAYTGSTTLASSAALTQYAVMIGGGAGAAPSTIAALTNNQVLVGTTGAAPSGSTTLAGLTLTTPTIASFANATHTHADAAGGGTLNASAIAAGTIATARLGSGSASASTFLRGDQSYATPKILLGGGMGADVIAAGQTRYTGPFGDSDAEGTESNALNMPLPAGTLTNFRVWHNAAAGAGQSVTDTLRLDGSDTALAITVSGASDQTGTDTDSVAVTAGQKLTCKHVATAGAASLRVSWSVEFQPS